VAGAERPETVEFEASSDLDETLFMQVALKVRFLLERNKIY